MLEPISLRFENCREKEAARRHHRCGRPEASLCHRRFDANNRGVPALQLKLPLIFTALLSDGAGPIKSAETDELVRFDSGQVCRTQRFIMLQYDLYGQLKSPPFPDCQATVRILMAK